MDNCSGHLRLATMYTRASSWISRPFRLSPSLSPVANYSGVSSGNCSLLYVWCILYLYIHSISIMRKAFIHCLYTSSGTNRPSLCSIFHSVVHDLLFRAGENEECRETNSNYSREVFTKNFRSPAGRSSIMTRILRPLARHKRPRRQHEIERSSWWPLRLARSSVFQMGNKDLENDPHNRLRG